MWILMVENSKTLNPEQRFFIIDEEERQNRHSNGWNNMFAFPWEISAAWDFTTRLHTTKGLKIGGELPLIFGQ